ncbi:MAG: hypothetical protein V4543_06645 [Bacteroidota bacterium]
MKENNEVVQNIEQIRSIMDRSSRFMFLSGWSGVIAGSFSIAAILWAEKVLKELARPESGLNALEMVVYYHSILLLALVVFSVSGIISVYLAYRNARQQGRNAFSFTGKRMAMNFLLPIVFGGLFCVCMLPSARELIPATMMMFYGIALLHSSKYSESDLYGLGIVMCLLGLGAAAIGHNKEFMITGFGVLHILFGLYMHYGGKKS